MPTLGALYLDENPEGLTGDIKDLAPLVNLHTLSLSLSVRVKGDLAGLEGNVRRRRRRNTKTRTKGKCKTNTKGA